MQTSVSQSIYSELLEALQEYVAENTSEALAPFRKAMAEPPQEWQDATITSLPAMKYVEVALDSCNDSTRPLVTRLNQHRHALKWEQGYTAADAVVGSDMLEGYGFVELLGKHGPFISRSVRSGIGVWGPKIDYPVHNHDAEEIYIPLAGRAEFTLNNEAYQERRVEEAVYVPSNLRHGFRTTEDPFVVLYIWQSGDLRQKSIFT